MAFFGFFVAIAGFLMGFYYFLQKVVLRPDMTPGLSSTVIFITFFSGIQLFSLGLMGEYVSRIYDEVKNRPMYIISEIIEKKSDGK